MFSLLLHTFSPFTTPPPSPFPLFLLLLPPPFCPPSSPPPYFSFLTSPLLTPPLSYPFSFFLLLLTPFSLLPPPSLSFFYVSLLPPPSLYFFYIPFLLSLLLYKSLLPPPSLSSFFTLLLPTLIICVWYFISHLPSPISPLPFSTIIFPISSPVFRSFAFYVYLLSPSSILILPLKKMGVANFYKNIMKISDS